MTNLSLKYSRYKKKFEKGKIMSLSKSKIELMSFSQEILFRRVLIQNLILTISNEDIPANFTGHPSKPLDMIEEESESEDDLTCNETSDYELEKESFQSMKSVEDEENNKDDKYFYFCLDCEDSLKGNFFFLLTLNQLHKTADLHILSLYSLFLIEAFDMVLLLFLH